MARLVLTDASPLIGLSRVDGLEWLGALFGTVWMPPEVRQEVLPGRNLPDEAANAAAEAAGWLRQSTPAPAAPSSRTLTRARPPVFASPSPTPDPAYC
jgi:hypothetical protein